MFLLTKAIAEELKAASEPPPSKPDNGPGPCPEPPPINGLDPGLRTTTLRLVGAVPPEIWNRLGTRPMPKLRAGDDLVVTVDFPVAVGSTHAQNMEAELARILAARGLGDKVQVHRLSAADELSGL